MSFCASVALNVKNREGGRGREKGREIVDGREVDFEVAVHINI